MDPNPEKTVFVPRAGTPTDLFQNGEIVGQYKVERVLGAGGMGVVYLVKHTALGKKFALKALPAKLGQEASFVKRFKAEAVTLGRLKHHHVVNVTDFGENQGRLYLVIEFVDGGSLEEWFEKNRKQGGGAPAADVQRFVSQILDGLAHAHQAGIVHRDLKLANVMLEKTGEAKISDFGLARLVDEEQYRREGGTAAPFGGDSVTTTGAIVGTIDYMSPEARSGQVSDARSDIYSIGVMAYQLLTGRKPDLKYKEPSQIVAGLDPRWDKFIDKCLETDPQNRYQNGAAALEAFKVILQPVASKRWMAPVAIAVVLAAAVGVWQWQKPAAPSPGPANKPAAASTVTSSPPAGVKSGVEPPGLAPAAPALRKFVITGLPADAVVIFHERNHPAGPAGRARLELPPGPQTVHIKAPGYLDWEGDVGAGENDTQAAVTMELVPPHPVRFTGLPAQTQLKAGDQTATADASGAAVLQLRPGHVTVAAAAPKYQPLELSLDVLQTTEAVPVEMKKLPPPAEVLVNLPGGAVLKFKWVPPGTDYVGTLPDERGHQRSDLDRTKVEIPKGMYFAETEMTQRQHRALTGKNPSDSRALGDDTRPVEQVAWRDLVEAGGVLDKMNETLHRLGLPYKADLPTEAEWEYACRAGTDTAFNDGSNVTNERDDPALDKLAYYTRGGSTHDAPSPVAKLKPNAWGIYDMLGNVSEWAYGTRGQREPVLRGGNWNVGVVHCRSASRVEVTKETRANYTMGYRLVLRLLEE
jgi:formylglycine-generating enzyme required for sulfatase activity/tRNA A-37 threonylcarbamoyl transferase component Bud32